MAYRNVNVTNVFVAACDECGAVVIDVAAHDRFHAAADATRSRYVPPEVGQR